MGRPKKIKEQVQPEMNIGLVGHVDHGKTTLTEALSGKWTDTHSEEIKRGITIRLGYADSVIRKCPKCKKYTVLDKCKECGDEPAEYVRKVSYVDAPGHESLMATMLSGATIMDGALLLVAANEECPQPQTREHLMALEISGIKNVVIVQNKIDLVSEEQALRNYGQIQDFIKDTPYKDAPIVPISAQYRVNIDMLLDAIITNMPVPKRDLDKDPIMYVARSFDINRPGTDIDKMSGGVLGGALVQGQFNIKDEIEIRPGKTYDEHGTIKSLPLKTTIVSLKTGGEDVKSLGPGGSIGVLTSLDPAVVKSDALTGHVVGLVGKLPPVWSELRLKTRLMERVVGVKDEQAVEGIKMYEPLMLNVNAAATVGIVTKLRKDELECKLKLPICADKGARITISRRIGTRFRLIGYGEIL
jgi:translation initiation factor 2 subunit 3